MKRHAFLRLSLTARSESAGRSGLEIFHSAMSASSTPSALAYARIAASSAWLHLFQPAYAILTADAAPGGPSTTIASMGPATNSAATSAAAEPERESRGVPRLRAGGPMKPP